MAPALTAYAGENYVELINTAQEPSAQQRLYKQPYQAFNPIA
jgi:hypothetical protein